eukprot:4756752-Alexandrium_andersonii.AAC.1
MGDPGRLAAQQRRRCQPALRRRVLGRAHEAVGARGVERLDCCRRHLGSCRGGPGSFPAPGTCHRSRRL